VRYFFPLVEWLVEGRHGCPLSKEYTTEGHMCLWAEHPQFLWLEFQLHDVNLSSLYVPSSCHCSLSSKYWFSGNSIQRIASWLLGYFHDSKMKRHCWSSNGNHVTVIGHWDTDSSNIGHQSQRPLYLSRTKLDWGAFSPTSCCRALAYKREARSIDILKTILLST